MQRSIFLQEALNSCDDPTRDVPLRAPTGPLPSWWSEVLRGNFHLLDESFPLPYNRGAPDFNDLLGVEPPFDRAAASRDFRAAKTARKKASRPWPDPAVAPEQLEVHEGS